jgi:hypothetical protein
VLYAIGTVIFKPRIRYWVLNLLAQLRMRDMVHQV